MFRNGVKHRKKVLKSTQPVLSHFDPLQNKPSFSTSILYKHKNDQMTYLLRSSPTKPACSIVKLSESGETMITVSSEYWVSRIDISCVTRTNTSATLSFGVPSLIGGGLIFWETTSDAYICIDRTLNCCYALVGCVYLNICYS